MIDAMTRSRMAKPLRVMTLSIALLLFAVGSNYCLVAALSGKRVDPRWSLEWTRRSQHAARPAKP